MPDLEVSIICLNNLLDKSGNTIGHLKKQIEQTIQILLHLGYPQEKIEVIAGRETLKDICCKNKQYLPCHVTDKANVDAALEMKAQLTMNYLFTYFRARGKYVWFIFVNENILSMLAVMPMRRKLIATTYMNWDWYLRDAQYLSKRRKQQIKKGLNRLDLCITTNPTCTQGKKSVFLPDYFRTEAEKELYDVPKSDQVASVGLITTGKNVTSVMKLFTKNDIGIPLVVKGRIRNHCLTPAQVAHMNRSGKVNVTDCYLRDDEYWKLLAESKFVIVNCNTKIYGNRTSGVLLDSIFVGCIPIAPVEILENNRIKGIGYTNIRQIPNLIQEYRKSNPDMMNDLSIYELEHFVKVLKPFFHKVPGNQGDGR